MRREQTTVISAVAAQIRANRSGPQTEPGRHWLARRAGEPGVRRMAPRRMTLKGSKGSPNWNCKTSEQPIRRYAYDGRWDQLVHQELSIADPSTSLRVGPEPRRGADC